MAAACWASVRPEYWPPKAGTPVPLGWNAPTILFGVTCLMFGVGTGAAGWIDRLIHSAWFAGLTPRPEDLAVSGGVAAGCWSVPVRNMDCKSAPKWDPIPKVGPSQDWGCGRQLGIFAFVLWPRVDAWLGW